MSERGSEVGRRESVFASSPVQVFRKGKQPPDTLAQRCDKDCTASLLSQTIAVKISTHPTFPKLSIGVGHNASGRKLRGPHTVCETRGPWYFVTLPDVRYLPNFWEENQRQPWAEAQCREACDAVTHSSRKAQSSSFLSSPNLGISKQLDCRNSIHSEKGRRLGRGTACGICMYLSFLKNEPKKYCK